jgi:hypothetical protein
MTCNVTKHKHNLDLHLGRITRYLKLMWKHIYGNINEFFCDNQCLMKLVGANIQCYL